MSKVFKSLKRQLGFNGQANLTQEGSSSNTISNKKGIGQITEISQVEFKEKFPTISKILNGENKSSNSPNENVVGAHSIGKTPSNNDDLTKGKAQENSEISPKQNDESYRIPRILYQQSLEDPSSPKTDEFGVPIQVAQFLCKGDVSDFDKGKDDYIFDPDSPFNKPYLDALKRNFSSYTKQIERKENYYRALIKNAGKVEEKINFEETPWAKEAKIIEEKSKSKKWNVSLNDENDGPKFFDHNGREKWVKVNGGYRLR